DAALHSLREGRGRTAIDHRVGDSVPLTRRKQVPFAEWEALEAQLLARLAEGDDPLEVLGVAPFPRLRRGSYEALADAISELADHSRIAAASVWFGDGVRAHLGKRGVRRPRPWAE